jgi:hypothetical protein
MLDQLAGEPFGFPEPIPQRLCFEQLFRHGSAFLW